MSDVGNLLMALINRTGVIQIDTAQGQFQVELARQAELEEYLRSRGQEPSLGFIQAAEAGRAFMAVDPAGQVRALNALLARRKDADGYVGLLQIEQDVENPVPPEVEQTLLDRVLAVRHNYVRMHTYWVLSERRDIYQSRGFTQIEELMRYRWTPADQPTLKPRDQHPVRDALLADIEELQRIDETAFDPMWRNDPSVMSSWVNRRSYRTRVVEYEGYPAGFSTYRYVAGLRTGHYVRTAVEPALQGRGLGRALLADAMQWFVEQEAERVELTTQVGNRVSRRLYEEFGFKPLQQLVVFVLERAVTL